MINYKIPLCLLLCLAIASTSYGRSNEPTDRNKESTNDGEIIPLYHEIINKKSPRLDKDDRNVEAIRVRSHADLATARIVGEVLEDNAQNSGLEKQEASPESEYLIQVTTATPRKLKKMKNSKAKHQKSKKTDILKAKKKRKQNKQAAKKRKYPKKYNGKKHGHKKMKKDKNHTKTNSKHEKRSKKGKSKSEKIVKPSKD